jgi:hypothetical protein
MKHRYLTAILLLVSAPLTGLVLEAQTIPGSPPSSKECAAAAAALSAGARDGAGWERLPECGALGGRALATAFRSARNETDTDYLGHLYGAMAALRDPHVFASALEVMQDPGASSAARATAILVAVAQHHRGWGLPLQVSFADAVTASPGESCRIVAVAGDPEYRSATSLPADYVQQLGKALDRVVADASTPPLVRSFAGCGRRAIVGALAASVPTSAIRLSYVCGNRFRATNRSSEPINVSYEVSGTKDRRDFTIAPQGETTFTTERRGLTRLFYQGKVVQTISNAGKPRCSRQ